MKWVPAPAWAKSEAVAEVPLVSSFFARHDSADEAKSSTSRPQPYEIDAQDIIIHHGNYLHAQPREEARLALPYPSEHYLQVYSASLSGVGRHVQSDHGEEATPVVY
jgi:hypothetical protein